MLHKEVREVWIALVQIWQVIGEPSIEHLLLIIVRCIRIEERLLPVIRTGVFRPVVDPVLRRRIKREEMFTADVIIDRILHHLDSALVRLVTKLQVAFVSSKPLVNLVVVGKPIAVLSCYAVSPFFRQCNIVLDNRRKPECSHPQFLEVAEALLYSFKVSSMAREHVAAIACVVAVLLYDVIRRIAVREPVGYHQVKKIL